MSASPPFPIRPETGGDAGAITAVNDAAFAQPTEGLLILELRSSEGFDPALSLVAESKDGTVIGHILFTPVRINHGDVSCRSLALAPMAVLPEYQRQGIGGRLVEDGLEACRVAGHESVIVLGHPEYYPRFGFAPASGFGVRCPFPNVPDSAFMAMELMPGALANISGVVEYPSPFSRF